MTLPFPLPLVGDGVVIDHLRPRDAAALSRSHSDPDNARFQGWRSPLSEEEALAFIDEQSGEGALQLAIREAVDGPLVGDLYVNRTTPDTTEIGLTLAPGCHGRGLGVATVNAVIGATAGTVRAFIDVDNVRSRRLFERAGFREVAQREAEGEVEVVFSEADRGGHFR